MHPDLTKLVSLSVKPLEKAEDAVTGGETLTVDTTAGDTTGVQDPTTEGGTVETVQTEEPTVEVQDPATEGGTVETVKTEKPKLNVGRQIYGCDLTFERAIARNIKFDAPIGMPFRPVSKANQEFR